MDCSRFRGTGVAIVTPFDASGAPDLPALTRIVNELVDGGIEFLVPMGTTAESVTLTEDEMAQCLDTVLAANAGRRPVLIGAGGSDTLAVARKMAALEQRYQFDGFLSVSPAYNKPTQEGIYQHYRYLSEHTAKPILLYNVPGRTAQNMAPETTLRIAHSLKNVFGIKEASPSLEQGMELIKGRPEGFLVLSGDDALALPQLAIGYDGVISVAGNALPASYSTMIRHGLAGRFDQARTLQYQLLELMKLNFVEGNPAGVKALLALRGWCQPHVRLPLVPATDKLTAAIAAEWKAASALGVS